MPKDDLSAVMKEAYMNAPSHLATLHTIEVRHPGFTAPLRIVRDQRLLNAKLETGAPVDGGTYQDFQPLYFTFMPPEITGDPDPTFRITIDNVTGVLTPLIEIAAASTDPISVTYRPYVWNEITEALDNSDEPAATPMHMEVFSVTAQGPSMLFAITMVPLSNRPCPFKKYSPQLFPGLVP